MDDWQEPITDAAVERAQAVLTPSQLEALKQIQAQQLARIRIAPPRPTSTAAEGRTGAGK